MEQSRAGQGAITLSKTWIVAAGALIILQACALAFVGLNLSQFYTQCPAFEASSVESLSTPLDPPSVQRSDKCFMGGILPLAQVAAYKARRNLTSSHVYGADGRLFPENFVPFSELLCGSTSDKQEHFYGQMYSEYLDPLRLQQEEVNLLEIGLRYGDSLNLWIKAFKSGKVYGLDPFYTDVTRNAGQTKLDPRVKIFRGDQENVTDLAIVAKHVQEEVGLLDFIVDDGGHTMGQQLTSFTHLFPLVKPGGFYFIEDLQTSYWEKKCHAYYNGVPYCYGGGPVGANHTTVSLIKSLVDVLNSDFMEDHAKMGAMGSGIYKVNPVDQLVGSVQCWRNMCVLRRKYEGANF